MKVLFIGNSHTYFNDMPATFADLWRSACGEKAEVTMLAYSSRSLAWHENEYFAVRFNILRGGYDYCVIQQQAHPFPGLEETEEPLRWMLGLCRQAGTVPLVVETWAEQRAPEHQAAMTEAYACLAEKYAFKPVPVGRIWQELLPEVPLFWQDGEHASPYGDYLVAATLCGVISGESRIYPPVAHDFIENGDIDFDAPTVIEGDTRVTLDPALTEKICAAIGRYI